MLPRIPFWKLLVEIPGTSKSALEIFEIGYGKFHTEHSCTKNQLLFFSSAQLFFL